MKIPIVDRRCHPTRVVGFVEISEEDAEKLARSMGRYVITPTAIDSERTTVIEFAIRARSPLIAVHHEILDGGYQPTDGELDASNPPRGGSGVPQAVPRGAVTATQPPTVNVAQCPFADHLPGLGADDEV